MLNGNLHTLLLQLTDVICLLNAWVAGNRQWKNITISKISMELYYLVLLMLTIDLFGQVSELQETLMTLPISKRENIARTSNWGKWRRNTTNYSWRWCLPFAFLDDETIWRCCINTRESLLQLSRARMITEGAFGKLKGRFRVLHLSAKVIKKLWK